MAFHQKRGTESSGYVVTRLLRFINDVPNILTFVTISQNAETML
jgi:hypothetical protein